MKIIHLQGSVINSDRYYPALFTQVERSRKFPLSPPLNQALAARVYLCG